MAIDKTSIIITLIVLFILLMLSPTQAVELGFKGMEDVVLGDTTEFDMYVDIESDERLPIKLLKLDISDGEGNDKVCWFLPTGGRMNQCPGVSIKKIYKVRKSVGDRIGHDRLEGTDQDYGFGVGFGYGYGADDELRYEVKIDTSKGILNEFGTGTNTFTLKALAVAMKGGNLNYHMYHSKPIDMIVS